MTINRSICLLGFAAVVACSGDDPATTTTTASSGPTSGAGGNASGGSGAGAGATTTSSGPGGGGTGGAAGTTGCGQAAADPSEEWVAKTVDVDGTTREWFVWLPPGYDPERPYPVVYQFHGCSSNPDRENNNPPIQNESAADAIVVRGRALTDCWDNSDADVAFFDAMVAEVESSFCADAERRFATGYSSGSFMTHRLACARGDVLRGVASIAGGMGGSGCAGQVAALLIHDTDDPQVPISNSEAARDRNLDNNGCDAGAATTPIDPAPCEAYAGCNEGYPVVWCQTTGQGHSRQDNLSAPAFWSFLSSL